jgi:signal transduction histidine kinase
VNNNTLMEMDTAQLSNMLSQLLVAQEAERRTISCELQEDVGQALAAIALNLRVLERDCSNTECIPLIGESRKLLATALHNLEQVAECLYPPAIESQGLGLALENYARKFSQLTQISVELDLEVFPRPSSEIEVSLFRIAQTAFENIYQNAFTGAIRLVLRQIDDRIYLLIEDSSQFHSPSTLSNWRLLYIIQRVEVLNGECDFSLSSEEGMQLKVIIPLIRDPKSHD